MRPFFVLLILLALAGSGAGADNALTGSGATTAGPIIVEWAKGYSAKGGPAVAYALTGSTAGVKAVTAGSVDFALSDARISVPDLTAAGLVQFPMLLEAIVPVVNLAGVEAGKLRLTGPLLADVFLGKVKTWNDPAIASLNPGLALPAQNITVIRRAEGSGSTFILTAYLSAVSPAWKEQVGMAAEVKWPVGVAEKGSDGVLARLESTPGAITYLDFGRVRKGKLTSVSLKNQAGGYVAPSPEGITAAAASAPWATAPAFAIVIVDQPGPATWPITGAVFAVVHREQKDAESGLAVLRFFDFALGEGAQIARDAGYVPVPPAVVKIVREAWPRLVKTAGGKSVWPAP